MTPIKLAYSACLVAALCCVPSGARAQEASADTAAVLQFQRSVDSYAFQHRQVQWRLGEGADQKTMAAGLRAARPSAAEGDFFTPIVAAVFRSRIAVALKTPGCEINAAAAGSEVPHIGPLTIETQTVPACVLRVLPRLPDELEYRAASIAIILLDTHANVVVDVLHAAVPMQR